MDRWIELWVEWYFVLFDWNWIELRCRHGMVVKMRIGWVDGRLHGWNENRIVGKIVFCLV